MIREVILFELFSKKYLGRRVSSTSSFALLWKKREREEGEIRLNIQSVKHIEAERILRVFDPARNSCGGIVRSWQVNCTSSGARETNPGIHGRRLKVQMAVTPPQIFGRFDHSKDKR